MCRLVFFISPARTIGTLVFTVEDKAPGKKPGEDQKSQEYQKPFAVTAGHK